MGDLKENKGGNLAEIVCSRLNTREEPLRNSSVEFVHDCVQPYVFSSFAGPWRYETFPLSLGWLPWSRSQLFQSSHDSHGFGQNDEKGGGKNEMMAKLSSNEHLDDGQNNFYKRFGIFIPATRKRSCSPLHSHRVIQEIHYEVVTCMRKKKKKALKPPTSTDAMNVPHPHGLTDKTLMKSYGNITDYTTAIPMTSTPPKK